LSFWILVTPYILKQEDCRASTSLQKLTVPLFHETDILSKTFKMLV
jgi:hypothetical protein